VIGVKKGSPLTVGLTMVSVLHGGLERDAGFDYGSYKRRRFHLYFHGAKTDCRRGLSKLTVTLAADRCVRAVWWQVHQPGLYCPAFRWPLNDVKSPGFQRCRASRIRMPGLSGARRQPPFPDYCLSFIDCEDVHIRFGFKRTDETQAIFVNTPDQVIGKNPCLIFSGSGDV
jgi:hypothetical protein